MRDGAGQADRGAVSRRRRSDARRNRAALLAAARDLYVDQGIDVALEEIARRAGLGIGTLYRHFPQGKKQVVSEALVDQASRYVAAARKALDDNDPWQGFVRFIDEICTMQTGDVGFSDLLAMTLPVDERVEQLRTEANGLVVQLIDRAKGAGNLRPDFVGEDLLLLLMANAAVVHVTHIDAPDASRRLVSLFIQAVARQPEQQSLSRPPTSDQMRRALARRASSRGCGASDPTDPPIGSA